MKQVKSWFWQHAEKMMMNPGVQIIIVATEHFLLWSIQILMNIAMLQQVLGWLMYIRLQLW